LDNWLQKSYINGLTLSGGDPLDRNEEELLEILDLCKSIKYKYPNKTIWIYTGYTLESLKDTQLEILKYCDVLVDGPYIESLRDLSLPFRGSSNQRIIYLNNEKK
jgi:anaerobic ribonucleoside-triphosphate reductase activating protein